MKKLLLFVLAIFAFAACEQAPIEEQVAVQHDAPESITVSFEGDDTRIQLNETQKTVWTKGDLVSVFYRSNANQQWKYDGETGARTANLKRVDAGTATRDMDRVVVVYPYNEDYYINPSTFNVQASLPATQQYLKDSYGVGDNLMVSQSEFTQFSLKNVCGWLKLQLTGNGEVVKSITFKGNDGGQVAGMIYVDTATAEATLAAEMGSADDNNAGGNLVFDDTILTEVTLDCGDGVTLGAEATSFYIALPPQTFEKGFTADVVCDGYKPMTISTSNEVIIERNHIQPMASKEHNASPIIPNNQIWYTSSNGKIVEPEYTTEFGVNIVSNTYADGKGIITCDGDITKIGFFAFTECEKLTSIIIPDSVTEIGYGAFSDCERLTSITFSENVTEFGISAFSFCSSLLSITIPDGVTEIKQTTFYGCKSLTQVTIPNSVTSIGKQAFDRCSGLTSITIPDGVIEFGDYAFSECSSLTSITIPDSIEEIGDHAFSYCTSLTSVNIPDSVTEIGYQAFRDCSSLTSVYCKATTPPSLGGTDVFVYNGSGRKIYVPAGSVETYKSAEYWSEYASDIVGYYF